MGILPTADSTTPTKKPWRYYYVVAFPVTNGVPKEKLTSMLELTETIERREEEYLTKMADRNDKMTADAPLSPLPRYVASVLKGICSINFVVAIVGLGVVYLAQASSIGDNLDVRIINAMYGIVAGTGVVNLMLYFAAKHQHVTALRALVFILALALVGTSLVLDQLQSILLSQQTLLKALRKSPSHLTAELVERVLNGGPFPSLWHRFFVDGPAWFLIWLKRQCAAPPGTESADDGEGLVDSNDFFAPFWKTKQAKTCARQSLETHLSLERVVQGALTGLVVVLTVQLVLCVVLLWIGQSDDSHTPTGTTRRKRRRRARPRPSTSSTGEAVSLSSVVRLASLVLVVTGSTMTVVSVALLTSCSFVGAFETWMLALVAAFGVVQVMIAVLMAIQASRTFIESILLAALALESYVSSTLTTLGPLLTPSTRTPSTAAFLRSMYSEVVEQTCQPVKHWLRHVCVQPMVSARPHGRPHVVSLVDTASCQDEFAALLLTTTEHTLVALTWMMVAQCVLLLWLLLPSARALVGNLITACCCVRRAKEEVGSNDNELLKKRTAWQQDTVPFKEARRLYLSTLRHTDASTLYVESSAFDHEWMKMTGRSHTEIDDAVVLFVPQFEAIVRTLVIRRLTLKCKLDISLGVASSGNILYVKVFASDNLLMTALCQSERHKLQFADAIDPGSSFWHGDKREIKADSRVLDTATIHQRFKLLSLHSVISWREAEIFPSESLARASARVHALTRISRMQSGSLVSTNTTPPFVSYLPQTQFQYLYKKYPNRLDMAGTTRRAAVLRTLDCLRLTREMLDAEFDFDLMQRHGLITAVTALHSASRFDTTSRASLLSSWVAFWRPRHLPGEYEPTKHWLLSQLTRLSPFRQPLRDVRDYFGERIAFYFAWLAFYNQFLLIPTIAVIVLLLTRVLDVAAFVAFYRHRPTTPRTDAFMLTPSATILGLAVTTWGFLFVKCWERRSAWYELEWGMNATAAQLEHTDRANFRGTKRRNPITQKVEVYFPGRERLRRQLASIVIVTTLSAVHIVVAVLVLLMQGVLAHYMGVAPAVALTALTLALVLQWNGDVISAIGHHLSEWENYQNDESFQRSVILKVFCLQLANVFAPLCVVAFGLAHVAALRDLVPHVLLPLVESFQTNVAPFVDPVIELQTLLLCIFGVRITSHVVIMVHSLAQERASSSSSSSRNDPPSVEAELALGVYRGSYEDYTEIVVQFGLVVLFSSIFPIGPLLAFLECALELRLDALDLCLFLQRPAPETARGIGVWSSCLHLLLKLSLVVNFALLYFMADNYHTWSTVRRVSAFLVSVLVASLVSELLWVLLPSTSQAMRDVCARHAFLIARYMGDDHAGTTTPGDGTQGGGGTNASRMSTATTLDELDSTLDDGVSPEHYHERLALLRRLNVALRKQEESHDAAPVLTPSRSSFSHHEPLDAHTARTADGDTDETMIVGYFRPVQGLDTPSPRRSVPTTSPVDEPTAHVVASREETEAPPPVPPPTTSAPLPPALPKADGLPERPSYERAELSGMEAIHVASERERFDFATNSDWQSSDAGRRTSSSRRFSLFSRKKRTDNVVPSTTAPPGVVQLSGLDAVHEATRRNQFDFSGSDPWHDGQGATL